MEFLPIIFIWSGLGLVGSCIMFSNAAEKGKATGFALFSLIHAIVFGPIFLLIALTSHPQKLCPHCKSSIRRDALVCPECTREVN